MQAFGYESIWAPEWQTVTESAYDANVAQPFKDGDSNNVPERSFVFKTCQQPQQPPPLPDIKSAKATTTTEAPAAATAPSMTLIFPSVHKIAVGDRLRVHLFVRPKAPGAPTTLLPDTSDSWELTLMRSQMVKVWPITDCFMWYPNAIVLRASKDKVVQQQESKSAALATAGTKEESKVKAKSLPATAATSAASAAAAKETFACNVLIGNAGCNFAMCNVPVVLMRRMHQLQQSKTPILVAFERKPSVASKASDQDSDNDERMDVASDSDS